MIVTDFFDYLLTINAGIFTLIVFFTIEGHDGEGQSP